MRLIFCMPMRPVDGTGSITPFEDAVAFAFETSAQIIRVGFMRLIPLFNMWVHFTGSAAKRHNAARSSLRTIQFQQTLQHQNLSLVLRLMID